MEYYALPEPVRVEGVLGAGDCKVWAETLDVSAKDVEVLLSFRGSNAWVSGKPAVVSRRCGRGRLTYCGGWLEPALTGKLVAWAASAARVRMPQIAPPEGVSLHELADAAGTAYILNNCTDEPREVVVPEALRDVLTDGPCHGSVKLGPRGVAVLV